MEKYLGVKIISAKPMNRLEYNKYRGWELPSDENGEDEGMLVEYEGSTSNHDNHKGYISWSPLETFNEAYRKTEGLTFGLAIEALKMGKCVARKGWNGKGMYLYLQEGTLLTTPARNKILVEYQEEQGSEPVKINSHIDMKTADGSICIGWLASQTDILSEDWRIV